MTSARHRAGSGRAAIAALIVVLGLLLAACSDASSSAPQHGNSGAGKPTNVITAPAGLIAGTAPQPSGTLWVLAGGANTKTLHQLSVSASSTANPVPVSNSAVDVVESSSDLLGLGLATATTGALEFRNGSSGALVSSVPIGAPVSAVFPGADGATFYVLNGTAASKSVSVVSSLADKVTNTVAVPSDTVSIAVEPSQQRIFALESTGTVREVAIAGGTVVGAFATGPSPVTLAISNDGSTLFVLKGTGEVDDVGVIDLATQHQLKALPAPAHTVDLQLSLDSTHLYDFVGTPTYGNVQVFPVHR
jgi:hypothetical protein